MICLLLAYRYFRGKRCQDNQISLTCPHDLVGEIVLSLNIATILCSTTAAPVLRRSSATEDGEGGSRIYETSRHNSGRDSRDKIPR